MSYTPKRSAVLPRTRDAWATPNNHLYQVQGIDLTDGRLLAIDSGAGQLKQSTTWGGSWSTSKGLPTNVTSGNVDAIRRFGNYLWLLGTETGGDVCVWRSLPQSGNTAFTWEKVLTFATGSTDFANNLEADDAYLYAAEYGDPVPDPSIYRISLADANGAGTNWVNVFTGTGWRHIHSVSPDPHNPGHVWVAGGDGVDDRIQRSTDYGATWTPIPDSSDFLPQLVSLTHTPTHVIGYGDGSGNETGLVAIDKATLAWEGASAGRVEWMAVPGGTRHYGMFFDGATNTDTGLTSATAAFSSADVGRIVRGPGIAANTKVSSVTNSTTVVLDRATTATATGITFVIERPLVFQTPIGRIAADPDTGAVYFHSGTGSTTPWGGLFVVPFLGGPIICLHVGNSNAKPVPGDCYIGNSRLWSGECDIPLIDFA